MVARRYIISDRQANMKYSAIMSDCQNYRYVLWRVWEGGRINDMQHPTNYVVFIGLNPSTADAVDDDPTIRRCIRYARDWGYGGLCMVNLFAYRATDPKDMKKAKDPVGPDNDFWLDSVSKGANMMVAAWGAQGIFRDRAREVRQLLLCDLFYLAMTKDKQPRHPLYLKASLEPQRW